MNKSVRLFLVLCLAVWAGVQGAFAQKRAAAFPQFSEGATEHYYFVQLLRNGHYLTAPDKGGETVIRIKPKGQAGKQLWKLVGTSDNFQLISKEGQHAYLSSEGINTTEGNYNPKPLRAGQDQTGGFKMVATWNTKFGEGFELLANNIGGDQNVLNNWGSPGNNNTIGLWKLGDDNNIFSFTEVADIPREEVPSTGKTGYVPTNDLTLWYDQPGTTARLFTPDQWYTRWVEYGLPLGDGQFGASFLGGIVQDQLIFNEKTLWSGTSHGVGRNYGKYEVFGSVYADMLDDRFSAEKGARDYFRQLDLTNATGKVSFADDEGTVYTREYIASNPGRVIVARYTASQSGKIGLRIRLESGKPSIQAPVHYENGEAVFSGKLQTVSFNARIKVLHTNGTMTTTDKGIEVRQADEVVIVLGGGTDYDMASPTYVSHTAELATQIAQRVRQAAEQGWDKLYKAHVEDYQTYFGRVDFDLEGTRNEMPTDRLIDQYRQGSGAQALMLERLYFAYGRYLEIASSRGVDVPSNLQGIWNDNPAPAWNADIHSNINVQMNYWPAEPTNLSEMHLPLLNFIWQMAEHHDEWKNYARESGQQRGWTVFTESNIFGGVGDFAHNYVIANAWLATHLWQHYRYTLDRDFLKKVFPAMLSATQFWMDRLVLDSDGLYVAPNEYSPEHGPQSEHGVAHAQQLVYELFSNTLEACKVLGDEAQISAEDLNTLKQRFEKLDNGLRTEIYNGAWGTWNLQSGEPILREWKYSSFDNYKADRNHRHMSHLMCLYPFSQIHPGSDLFKAAVNSMKLRGDGATGWSMGWKINLWARALDGDHARQILNNALKHADNSSGVYYNLYDAHNPFQIDGNFGACAGMAEMLMQSNSDTIRILPALPSAWETGHIKGLKAVKDFTVSIAWKDRQAVKVTIVSNKGQEIPVLYEGFKKAVVKVDGQYDGSLKADDRGVVMLKGKAGTQFEFLMGDEATGIEEVAAGQGLQLSVQHGELKVAGQEVRSIRIYDLQGRLLQTAATATLPLHGLQHAAYVVEVTAVDGQKAVQKIVVE